MAWICSFGVAVLSLSSQWLVEEAIAQKYGLRSKINVAFLDQKDHVEVYYELAWIEPRFLFTKGFQSVDILLWDERGNRLSGAYTAKMALPMKFLLYKQRTARVVLRSKIPTRARYVAVKLGGTELITRAVAIRQSNDPGK